MNSNAASHRARLVSEICLEPYGASLLFVEDVNNDGHPELLWVQSMGIFHSRIYTEVLGKFPYLRREDRSLWCITATDLQGNILWRHGAPHRGEAPYCSHGGDGVVAVADIDNDGRMEVVCLAGANRLVVLDGCSGEEKNARIMPADNFSVLRLARTGDDQYTILATVSEQAYPPHAYGSPTLFLNASLEIVKEIDILGSGHFPKVFDADDDGCDEFLIGYSLIDHNLDVLWSMKWWEDHEFDPITMHADYADIYRAPGTQDWFAAIAGSNALYLVDRNGELLWRAEGPHPQHCLFGSFRPRNDGPRIFLLNQRYEMNTFSFDGQQLWKGLLPENWPLGVPKAVEQKRRFHMGVPASLWRNPLGDGTDLVVYNEAGWPYAVNGYGETIVEFPIPDSARQDLDFDVPSHRADDYGFGYHAVVFDFDVDGDEEVVIFDRRRAWFYELGQRPHRG